MAQGLLDCVLSKLFPIWIWECHKDIQEDIFLINQNISSSLALLKEIIVKVCCLGCTQLEYLPEKDFVGKYMDYPLPSDIIIPVQNHVEHTKFFNAPYQTLMFVQKISLFAKQVHNPPKNIMSTLFWSLLRAWPLLLMALSLAVVSGCIIWLLVSLTVWISIMHSILLSHSFIK